MCGEFSAAGTIKVLGTFCEIRTMKLDQCSQPALSMATSGETFCRFGLAVSVLSCPRRYFAESHHVVVRGTGDA